jgi:hypothetical protein
MKKDLHFKLYKSRNGYHIFLMKPMDFRSDESILLMHELSCDLNYIIFSYIRGWCVRLNKKEGEEENIYKYLGDIKNSTFISSKDEHCVDLDFYQEVEYIQEPKQYEDTVEGLLDKLDYKVITDLSKLVDSYLLQGDSLELLCNLHILISNIPVFEETSLMPAPI